MINEYQKVHWVISAHSSTMASELAVVVLERIPKLLVITGNGRLKWLKLTGGADMLRLLILLY